MARNIKKDLQKVNERISKEIKNLSGGEHTGPGPNYRAGIANEGYVGGYQSAINDVILALNNVKPHDRYYFWQDFEEK